LLEICRGSGLAAEVRFEDLPLIPEALDWAKQGVATGASERNWKGYGAEVSLPGGFEDWKRKLLSDPQTSGGLLVACDKDSVTAVLKIFSDKGFAEARVVGKLSQGEPKLTII
jgi:selenide,water dikinase